MLNSFTSSTFLRYVPVCISREVAFATGSNAADTYEATAYLLVPAFSHARYRNTDRNIAYKKDLCVYCFCSGSVEASALEIASQFLSVRYAETESESDPAGNIKLAT